MKLIYSMASLCLLFVIPILAPKNSEYVLVWEDNFEGEVIDTTFWSFQEGDGCPHLCGWGNKELQYYTSAPSNIALKNGHLVIQAHKQKHKTSEYTSAKLITRNKLDWKYGRIEIKAKIPDGLGTWPAFWMLPTLDRNMSWPRDGEIDIMEHVGYNAGMIYGTIHTEKFNHMLGTNKTDSIRVNDAHAVFHTYAIEWDEEGIAWFVDDVKYNDLKKNDEGVDGWPFNEHKFHLIINLAVGGHWGGAKGIGEDIWPQQLIVDYVKYFEKS